MASLTFNSASRPINAVVDRVYNNVEQALGAVRRLAGADGAHTIAYDVEDGVISVVATTGTDGGAVATEPLRAAIEADKAFVLALSMPRWIGEPDEGLERKLLIKLADEAAGPVFLLLHLLDGSTVAQARLMRLIPDLVLLIRDQMSISARLSDAEEMRDAAREALDHGECGVIAVRADHSVVFANMAGSRHLAGQQGLRLRRGVLRPVDHSKAIRFDAALDSVIDPGRQHGPRARASVFLLESRGDDSRPTIIVVAPAAPASSSGHPARGAAAMIYILAPAQGAARGLETLCLLHGLSRVETHLIANLVDGLTLTESAAAMRIKVDTARTYLKQVFVKTGTRRQADLVSLMTRYLHAVRGDFDFHPG